MASVNKSSLDETINLATKLYASDKKSIPDIAEILNWPRSRVRDCLINNGVTLRSRKEGINCSSHKLGKHLIGKKRTFTNEWKENIKKSAIKRGELLAEGVSFKKNGYVEYTRGDNKFRSVHVVTMESRIGRRLMPDEVVHHIDGNKHNNEINNLALMTRAAHMRLHRREEKILKGSN